jgi:hypothetical protein
LGYIYQRKSSKNIMVRLALTANWAKEARFGLPCLWLKTLKCTLIS